MSKQPSTLPLPPLSIKALEAVERIERYSSSALIGCRNIGNTTQSFNTEKALRILRTCVVEVLDAQLAYYVSLAAYQTHWVDVIIDSTISSSLGLDNSNELDYEKTKTELLSIVKEHLAEKRKSGALNPPHQSPIDKRHDSIGQQLRGLQEDCRLTVEELAEYVNLAPRSVYRHLLGDSDPRKRHIASYEKFFSKRLSREIRLIMSAKRQ